ncbi:MAG: hypothetical protein ACPG52_02805 [Cognaticolwellia sp.]
MDIMTEQLPISIRVSDDLLAKISTIAAVSNKLEAQLNFHTMTANWYEDEESILWINFQLLDAAEFNTCSENQASTSKQELLADDVQLFSLDSQHCECHVAITASELQLLQTAPKLLSGYLAKKLTKVLNMIAQRQGFEKI